MKRIYLAYIALIVSSGLFAQSPVESDANIFGDVKSGGKHISFVTIAVKGTNIVATTDVTGHYKLINLEVGEHTIVAQSFGYLHKEKTILIEEGKTFELNFELEEDLIGIEEVIVSSDRSSVDRKSSSIIVNTINPEVFAMTNSVSLAEGLDFTPGLRTECNCQNCGFTQIRMNGLEGTYSQIMINSRPVFSGLAGVYGLELFPANMIEKVEVVRGGGSALFGGNAIAGTINIITKEPISNSFGLTSNINAVGIGHETTEKITFDKSLNFNVSIVSDDLKSGMSIFGLIRDRDPYDENNDGFSEEVLMENQTVGISSFYKPTIRMKLSLDLYKIHEFRRGGDQFDKLPHETLITEQLEHNILGGNLGFDLLTKSADKLTIYTAGQTVNRRSYYGAQGDPEGYGLTEDISTSSGFHYSGNFKFISESKIVAGIDHSYNKLNDIKLGVNGEENTTISNQTVNTLGSFIQYDLKFNRVKISAGIRYDNYQINDNEEEYKNLNGNVIIPRTNILVDISDHLQTRASFAKGYRAPQIFDEDLHIESSGIRRITNENSPDLVQETSDSYSASFIYDNILGNNKPVQFEIIAEGFYTILNNPFVKELSVQDEFGNVVFVRRNVQSGAYVYGLNVETSIAFSKKLITQIGFTHQKSLYEEDQQWGESEFNLTKSFVRTPDNYGFFTLEYSSDHFLKIALTGTYTGRMLVPHLGATFGESNEIDAAINAGDIIEGERLETSDDFYNLGFKMSYDIELKSYYNIRFNLGMQNLLNQTQHDHDRGVYRDVGYIYGPHKSRSVFFGLEIGTGI